MAVIGAPPSVASLERAVAEAPAAGERVRALCALAHARDARTLALAENDVALDAISLHALARCHFYRADFVVALELMLAALKGYQTIGDASNAAIAAAG